MALPVRQPIQDNDNESNQAAANDNFEIKNASIDGKGQVKVEENKIKLNLDSTPKRAENDNIEIPTTPKTDTPAPTPETKIPTDTTPTTSDSKPTTQPADLAPKQPQPNNQPTTPSESAQIPDEPHQNESKLNQQPQSNNPPTQTNPEENKISQGEGQPQTKPTGTQPTTNQTQPQNEQQTPKEDQQPGQKAPPLLSDEPKMWRSDANPNANKRLPQPNAPTKEELSDTGPHSSANKAPATISPQKQDKAASELSASKYGGNIIQSGKQALQNTAKNTLEGAKGAVKNKVANIAQSLQSDRSRKIQLGRQRRKLESELRQLENKMDGVNASKYMRIIKFWFPSIYAAISGLGSGIANIKGEAKVAALSSKLLTAQTIKATLKTTEGISALVEANIKAISWIVESIETVIIPILLIIVYPIIILILWIQIELMGAMNAPITKSIKELVKEVDQIIDSLEKVLKPEREKIQKRREIQTINRLMAASSQDRKMHLQQQAEQEEYARSSEQNNEQNNINNSQPAT